MTDSRKFGSAVLATVSIADEHLDVWTRTANAMNKQQPARAIVMATLLEEALGKLDAVVEQTRSKTLAERYEAFTPELKAKLAFEKGRLYFSVAGVGLESSKWPERLKSGGHELSKWGADILSKHEYDSKHRLEADKVYKLALVLGTEFATDAKRSTGEVKAFARHEFGDQSVDGLKGELTLLIREKFTNAELEEMGLWYIVVLHEPIIDSDGSPSVLCSSRRDGSYVGTRYASPVIQWRAHGAFAFPA
ncbi:TPA: hypothetical protein DEP94_03270 [Candidatus Nomurabacteria bacterium]|uniref:Uncharacterized protein n=1 Tax=Candidatus Collierbacteria bacterium RIFOXYD1_FULL_40_9 TaxID=1817731 RepID=A0A1F5FPH3_9BACT|nr:MAG: hypothetical protein A2572_02755 [Candidatus Collierbacteria bacterium RIFOXYD1_FULL_40_9]HCC06349.1 hypothetical protein [Candidatus Nomurabacteria bacterium]